MSFWIGFIVGLFTGEFVLLIILLLCYIGSEKK